MWTCKIKYWLLKLAVAIKWNHSIKINAQECQLRAKLCWRGIESLPFTKMLWSGELPPAHPFATPSTPGRLHTIPSQLHGSPFDIQNDVQYF